MSSLASTLFTIIFSQCLFVFEREREREREEDTDSKAGSRLWAISAEPDVGIELMIHEIVTWAKVGHLTNSPELPWATQALLLWSFITMFQLTEAYSHGPAKKAQYTKAEKSEKASIPEKVWCVSMYCMPLIHALFIKTNILIPSRPSGEQAELVSLQLLHQPSHRDVFILWCSPSFR